MILQYIMFLPCDLSLDPCVSLAHTWLTQASLGAQLVKNPPAKQETAVQFLDQKGYPFQYSQMEESTRSAGDVGSIPGLGKSPGAGNGYPLP